MNEFSGERLAGGGDRAYGVTVGIVKANTLDAEARIEVRLPAFSDADIAHKARLTALMAGNGRGTFFVPEVGDEVLVAFEHGDMSRPYVLGGLWNGQDKPPDTEADVRVIKSRSGHTIRLDDTEGRETIEIVDGKGENRITIDTVEKTMTIKSAGNVRIEAESGTISMRAQTIELSSTGKTNVQASGGLALDGTPGVTNLKGSTINLN